MNAQLAVMIVCGGLAGAGLWLILRQLIPTHPDLGAAIDAMSPRLADRTAPDGTGARPELADRLGGFALRQIPGLSLPKADLAITQTPADRHVGQKLLLAAFGLVVPLLPAAMLTVAGVRLPFLIPAGVGLAFAALFFITPDLTLRDRAKNARADFARAVAAYVELVALERSAASGTVHALESAATVADSWPFQRLREQLLIARLDGVAPWTALGQLADELAVPELADFAGTMRLAGEESAQVYNTLRSQARSMRGSALSAEHTRANARTDSMTAPAAATGMVFLALLMAPPLMRML